MEQYYGLNQKFLVMAPSKKSDDIDRISDLPINVIDNILHHLPIQDIARTSLLSRKWRQMWYSIPQLVFDDSFFEECRYLRSHEIYNIITKNCLIHNSPIYKFVLCIPWYKKIEVGYLANCILILSRKGIKHLDLSDSDQLHVTHKIPSNIFLCNQLTHLKLTNFKLSVPPNFCGFKRLLDLSLYNIIFEAGALESLISSCPLLQKLIIYFCSGFESIDVSAPSLKVLCLHCSKIIKSICLEKAKNLIDLRLMAITTGLNFERNKTSNLIKGLQKIERLVLKEGYTQILSAGVIPSTMQRSFSFLKYLELNGVNFNGREQLLFILSLLKSTPCLAELDIEDNFLTEAPQSTQVSNHLELECNDSCFNELQIVTIKVRNPHKYALDLSRLILANSPSLETLTFNLIRILKSSDAGTLLGISQELLKMTRASQKAKVNFLYNK